VHNTTNADKLTNDTVYDMALGHFYSICACSVTVVTYVICV